MLKRVSYYKPAKDVYDSKLKKIVTHEAVPSKWQLKITVNTSMVVGSSIGLKVMYKSPMQEPYLINEFKGSWSKLPGKEAKEYVLDFEGAPGYGYHIGICLGMMLMLSGNNEYMYYYGETYDSDIGEHKIDMSYSNNVSKNPGNLVKIASKEVPEKPLIFKLHENKQSEIKSDIPIRSI